MSLDLLDLISILVSFLSLGISIGTAVFLFLMSKN